MTRIYIAFFWLLSMFPCVLEGQTMPPDTTRLNIPNPRQFFGCGNYPVGYADGGIWTSAGEGKLAFGQWNLPSDESLLPSNTLPGTTFQRQQMACAGGGVAFVSFKRGVPPLNSAYQYGAIRMITAGGNSKLALKQGDLMPFPEGAKRFVFAQTVQALPDASRFLVLGYVTADEKPFTTSSTFFQAYFEVAPDGTPLRYLTGIPGDGSNMSVGPATNNYVYHLENVVRLTSDGSLNQGVMTRAGYNSRYRTGQTVTVNWADISGLRVTSDPFAVGPGGNHIVVPDASGKLKIFWDPGFNGTTEVPIPTGTYDAKYADDVLGFLNRDSNGTTLTRRWLDGYEERTTIVASVGRFVYLLSAGKQFFVYYEDAVTKATSAYLIPATRTPVLTKPAILTSTLTAVVGQDTSFALGKEILTSDCSAPSRLSGTLPEGLTFSADGQSITGKIMTEGNYALTLTVLSGNGLFSEPRTLTLTVVPAPEPEPIISAVVHAGDFRRGLGSGHFTVFGTNLATSVAVADLSVGQAPFELNRVTITVNGRITPILYVGPGQVNAIMPKDTVPGTVSIEVDRNGYRSKLFVTDFIRHNMRFFQNDAGLAAIVDLRGSLISLENPIRPAEGNVYLGFGSGCDAFPPTEDGYPATASPLSVSSGVNISLPGATVETLWVGLAPGFISLCQINFRVTGSDSGLKANVVTGRIGGSSFATALQ
jgi:uncharacterized protein (TIGR03437 family)